jgi:sec-independent protein translocase protein TatC
MTDIEYTGDLIEDRGDQPRSLVPVPPEGSPPGDKVMTLVDHLAELRRRIAISLLAVIATSVIGFLLSPQIIILLSQPVGRPLQFITPGGAFFTQVKIALIIGIALALPVVLYQLWAFVAPGLTAHERRVARPWVPLVLLFFLLGVGVAYFVYPFAIQFLIGFQIPGVVEANITVESYFGFITMMFLGFGVVMQFPIALVLLAKLGVLDVDLLRRSRRYALLGITVFAVVATPGGDPLSPLVMGGVMYLLFELTILMLRRSRHNETRRTDG